MIDADAGGGLPLLMTSQTQFQMDLTNQLGETDDGFYFTKKGNLLADNPEKMDRLFANCKSIIATHSEKEAIIEKNE